MTASARGGGEFGPTAGGRAPLVLLAAPCPATNAVAHALTAAFGEVPVVLEPNLSRWALVRRRARTLGPLTVGGQLLFSALAVPVLVRRGRSRVAAIVRDHRLDLSPPAGVPLRVPSVNSEEARRALRRLDPSVVVVSGTRIICTETLRCVDATFVNLHAGVTPQYRGVHGGYWALAEGRPDLVGTTVHVVDPGVDTGPVLARATFDPGPADSFATYPYLHLAAGLPLLVASVAGLLAGDEAPVVPPLSSDASRLRSHPTLWAYLAARARRGVR